MSEYSFRIGRIRLFLKGLSPDRVSKISLQHFQQLKLAIDALPVDCISALSSDQVRAIEDRVKLLADSQVVSLTREQIQCLTPVQLNSLPLTRMMPWQIGWLTADQLSSAEEKIIVRLAADQVAALRPDQLHALRPSQLSAIRPDLLTRQQLKELSLPELWAVMRFYPFSMNREFMMGQIRNLGQERITSLTEEELSSLLWPGCGVETFILIPRQISFLTCEQIRKLPLHVLRCFSEEQIRALTPAQIAELSPPQKSILSEPRDLGIIILKRFNSD